MNLAAYLASEDRLTKSLAAGLTWIQEILGKDDVEARLKKQNELRGTTLLETFDTVSAGARQDQLGWYLYNAWTFLTDPPSYDTNAGCRIVPTLVALGGRSHLLSGIKGADDRLRAAAAGRIEIEKALFELLVAALYAANGWAVAFVQPSTERRTPEFTATKGELSLSVECKRLAKNSGYNEQERERWMVLVKPVADCLRKHVLPVIVDVVFHVELSSLPETYLADVLVPKLKLAVPGVVIDSKEMTVSLRPVDLTALRKELEDTNIKTNGSRIHYLVFGTFDRSRGYRLLFMGKQDECHPLFFKSVEFAAGISWSCDAPRALEIKARDIRDRLADAVEQLPDDTPGVVHVAVESYDGPIVEQIRSERIAKSLTGFETASDLRAVSVHLLNFETPPDEAWAIEETVTVTSFAPGPGATIHEHEASPYVLEKRHAWTF